MKFFIVFTRSIIAILPILKGHHPVMHEQVFERNWALMYILLLNRFGKHRIINEDYIMFTRNCGLTTDDGWRTKGDHKSSPCHYVDKCCPICVFWCYKHYVRLIRPWKRRQIFDQIHGRKLAMSFLYFLERRCRVCKIITKWTRGPWWSYIAHLI